jgi:DNA-binding response OmpR family regulator
MEHPGVILPRERLAERLYRRPLHPSDRRLDVLVSRLRRKLTLKDNPARSIRTIRGSGYVFHVHSLPQTRLTA